MTTLPAPAPRAKSARPKPPRSVRVLSRFQTGGLLINLTVGKDSGTYRVLPIPSDFGTAFEVAELLQADDLGVEYADPPYHVLLGDTPSCDCKGGLRHGHCKHGDGMVALRERGRL